MTLKERRTRLRLNAKEAALEREVFRALDGLRSDASIQWLEGTVRRGGTVPVESLPSRLAGAAGIIRRTFADGYVVAKREVAAWLER